MKESDVCAPGEEEEEGKHNLQINKDKGVLGGNKGEEEVPLWGR